jgi:hypothetical protein
MSEITVLLPDQLKDQAEHAARVNGLSLDQFVRHCISMSLSERAKDPMFADLSVYTGDAPPDLSERHDDYLYGEGA